MRGRCGPERRVRRSGRLAGIGLSVMLLGCRATQDGSQRTSDVRRADQLAVRSPDDMPSPWTSRPALGALEATDTPLDQARGPTPKARAKAASPTLPPILIAADAKRRPYALRDGALVVQGGLIVHRVPRGVTVQTVSEQQTGDDVWEIADARGRRIALLKARSWRRAAATSTLLDETSTVRSEARRTDWGGAPVRVVTDRFRSDTHIYLLERRAVGTDWIWRGLELSGKSTPTPSPR